MKKNLIALVAILLVSQLAVAEDKVKQASSIAVSVQASVEAVPGIAHMGFGFLSRPVRLSYGTLLDHHHRRRTIHSLDSEMVLDAAEAPTIKSSNLKNTVHVDTNLECIP